MKKHLHLVLALALAGAAFGLAACSSTPDCLKDQSYMNARTLPTLKSPAGLSAPKPDPDMQVPNVNAGPVGAYANAPSGIDSDNSQSRCLTTPPPISAG